MTDYVAAYFNPTNVFHKEAVRLGLKVVSPAHVTTENGVVRWKSNGAVIPDDCALLAYALGAEINLARHRDARETEQKAAIEAYKKAQAGRGMTDEEKSEARAAFGGGSKVVNIFTGRVTQL